MARLLHLPIIVCVALIACSGKQRTIEVAETGSSFRAASVAPSGVALITQQVTYDVDDFELGTRAAGVQLARMVISEATSLQPLNHTWKLDMQGILQVTRDNQDRNESLLAALQKMSPHVATLKPATDPRQSWLSTLPARGIAPPVGWVECVEWEIVRGRNRGIPSGCNGAWKLGAGGWAEVRAYAIDLVQKRYPPAAVQGNPLTWGGLMDIAAFLKKQPNMCWLESGPTVNYFFGLKNDPANDCKHMPVELVQESRTLSAALIKRAVRKRTTER
jgi:hypothetical protein